jgi:hypothetical protein
MTGLLAARYGFKVTAKDSGQGFVSITINT